MKNTSQIFSINSKTQSAVWHCLAGLSMMIGQVLTHSAHAADVLPGAFTPLPAGLTAGQVFFTHIERDKQYVNGTLRPINARLDSDIAQVRIHRFMDIGGYRVDPNVIWPFGEIEGKKDSSSLGKADGAGDIILNVIVWLVNDSTKKNYFGIAPYVFAPTGEYDKNKALNLGENRWKYVLQGGYNTALTDNLLFDLTGDVTIYGKNKEFGTTSATLRQDDSYQVQTYLRYKILPTLEINAGLSHVWGGETEVNGVKRGNPLRTSKYMIGGSYFLQPKTQLLGLFGRDVERV